MRRTSLFLVSVHISALLAANLPQEETPRDKKVFSLFSIVQFPNQECDTTDPNVNKGVCTTSTECTDGAGTAAGQCASGFGVCCIFKTNSCGSTISKNISYIQNPDFPSTYSTTGTCNYKIDKIDSTVCQVRLDFDTMVLGGNDETGSYAGCCGSTCGSPAGSDATDSLTVEGKSGKNPPSICHTNTGYHMYVETGNDDSDQVSLDFYLSDTAGSTTTLGSMLRKWNIKVTQIPCATTYTAPTDCLQYYTGIEGYIQSFGFGSGQFLYSQNYQACIRQEEGYCGIEWHPSSRTSPDSFGLLDGTAADTGENVIGDCLKGFINIPSAEGFKGTDGTTAVYHSANVYSGGICGEGWTYDGTTSALGPIRSFETPFRLEVFSDDSNAKMLSDTTSPATGFEMVYRQIPCGSL